MNVGCYVMRKETDRKRCIGSYNRDREDTGKLRMSRLIRAYESKGKIRG